MERIHQILQDNIELISTRVTDYILEHQLEPYCHFPREAVLKNSRVVFSSFVQEFISDDDTYRQYWARAAQIRANENIPLSQMIDVMSISKGIIYSHFAEIFSDDSAAHVQFVWRANEVLMRGLSTFFHAYSDIREELIRQQDQRIRELATPIMPLYEGILVLPLVGEVDQRRVSQIMEEMLESIVQYQADLMLVDITGVPLFDSAVAHHFIQLARAVRLLGADLIIVGISPEIAQSMVEFDLALSDMHIRSNLQSGIVYALELRGLEIKPIEK